MKLDKGWDGKYVTPIYRPMEQKDFMIFRPPTQWWYLKIKKLEEWAFQKAIDRR